MILRDADIAIKSKPVVFGGDIYQGAYASLNRLEGRCDLLLAYKNESGQKRKEMLVSCFSLCFNHEGIKDHWVGKACREGTNTSGEYVPLSVIEAAALLQDAYLQNQRFQTPRAEGLEKYCALLDYDTSEINRGLLSYRLSNLQLTSRMFVNIYLAALRRMDNALLYDLSGQQRKEVLGDRKEFILNYGEEYRGFTFIRNGITWMKTEGDTLCATVSALVITPLEELMKISYLLRLSRIEGRYCVDSFEETGREILGSEHPENPFNYMVHCSIYNLSSPALDLLKEWSDGEGEIFLTGELQDCLMYKWLKKQEQPWEEFDLYNSIIGEFIFSDKQAIVYSRKPGSLIEAERKIARYLFQNIVGHNKFYIPACRLYQVVFSRHLDRVFNKDNELILNSYRGRSALIHINDYYPLVGYLHRNSDGKTILGPRSWYYFIKTDSQTCLGFKEYYISGNWLKIYSYKEELEKEIEYLSTRFRIKDVVFQHELENCLDAINPIISEQRKWYIYGMLQKFYKEDNMIQEFAQVPSLRDVVKTMGGVKTSISG